MTTYQTTRLEAVLIDPNQTASKETHNEGLNMLADAQAKRLVVNLTSETSPYTIPYSPLEGDVKTGLQFRILKLTGTLGGAFNVIVPDREHEFIVHNAGDDNVTVKTLSGTGVTVAPNALAIVYCDGTNVDLITAASGGSVTAGRQTVYIDASGIIPRTTNGPEATTREIGSNKVMASVLKFDSSTQEYAQFKIKMPKSWNLGTIKFVPVWLHEGSGSGFGVTWELSARAFSDGAAVDAAFGTVQKSVDSGGTADHFYHGPESSAITIAGSPAALDLVVLQISRNPGDGGDTLNIDAELVGLHIYYVTNADNDN